MRQKEYICRGDGGGEGDGVGSEEVELKEKEGGRECVGGRFYRERDWRSRADLRQAKQRSLAFGTQMESRTFDWPARRERVCRSGWDWDCTEQSTGECGRHQASLGQAAGTQAGMQGRSRLGRLLVAAKRALSCA